MDVTTACWTMTEVPVAEVERSTERWFAYACVTMALPVVVAFTAIDLSEGDTAEASVDVAMAVVLTAGFVGVRVCGLDRLEASRSRYRKLTHAGYRPFQGRQRYAWPPRR